MEEPACGGRKPAGYLVSATLRKTWYTCRKSCLGTPCSPSRFCSNRGSDEATFPTRPGPSPQGPFPGTRLTGRGPPAQSQGRPDLCSGEGHLTTFGATAHPANYFHVSGKPIWTVSKRGDRFPGSLPCCDRVSAVSVSEQRPLQPMQTLPLVRDHVHHPEACTLAAPSAIGKNRGTPTRRSNLAGGPSAQLSACLPCARHSRTAPPPRNIKSPGSRVSASGTSHASVRGNLRPWLGPTSPLSPISKFQRKALVR